MFSGRLGVLVSSLSLPNVTAGASTSSTVSEKRDSVRSQELSTPIDRAACHVSFENLSTMDSDRLYGLMQNRQHATLMAKEGIEKLREIIVDHDNHELTSTTTNNTHENAYALIDQYNDVDVDEHGIVSPRDDEWKEQERTMNTSNTLHWYQKQNEVLEKLKGDLRDIRLRGGVFLVQPKGSMMRMLGKVDEHILHVSNAGRISVYRPVTSSASTAIAAAPPSTSSEAASHQQGDVSVSMEGQRSVPFPRNKPIFRHIVHRFAMADLKMVAIRNQSPSGKADLGRRLVQFSWKNGKTLLYYANEGEELVEMVGCFLRKFNANKVGQILRLKRFYEEQRTAFDASNVDHASNLKLLWELSFPDLAYPGQSGEEWKSLGFQHSDPVSDFRGMGILGLKHLVYFAKHRSKRLHRILTKNREYPFAAVGINVSSLLSELLQLHVVHELSASDNTWTSAFLDFLASLCDESLSVHGYGHKENGYEEFYCMCLELLDYYYVTQKAKYMDFPHIFAQVKSQIKAWLDAKPMSFVDIEAIILAKYPNWFDFE